MSKKNIKKASIVRTVSLAIGSLSLFVIAVSQVTNNEICRSSDYSIKNQIRLSWFSLNLNIHIDLVFY